MPPQLPGLRWDNEKRRYFPLARHQTPIVKPVPAVEQPRRRLSSYHALAHLRSVCRTAQRDALIHQIQSSQFSLTEKTERHVIPLQGLVSAFQDKAISHNGRVYSFVGDTLGWFYSSTANIHADSESIDVWLPQYHLSSEVSSIALSPTACLATSFGPECRILYLPLDSPIHGTHVSKIESRIVHDVWTTDLHGARLVLGANKQAVIIEDISVSTSLRCLSTKSDVFALAQRENLLYTGLRNGALIRFDTRIRTSSSVPLFDSVSQRTSSITGLKHLHDNQLLASFLDGGISTFDLRFPIRTPLLNFTGNVNSYTTRLPLETDPHEKFLFAAGQDNRIRIWSLATGGPSLDRGGTDGALRGAFERPFEHRVASLQVVEEREGMCLWAASGTELCKYSLGHRLGIGVQGSGG